MGLADVEEALTEGRAGMALGRLERGTVFTWRTMSCKSPMLRRADQIRVTIRPPDLDGPTRRRHAALRSPTHSIC
jgi:hypothetical protein